MVFAPFGHSPSPRHHAREVLVGYQEHLPVARIDMSSMKQVAFSYLCTGMLQMSAL